MPACLAFASVPTRHHPAAIDCPHTSASHPGRWWGSSASYHVARPDRVLLERVLRSKKETNAHRSNCGSRAVKLTPPITIDGHVPVSLHNSLLQTLTTVPPSSYSTLYLSLSSSSSPINLITTRGCQGKSNLALVVIN
jgi:hypothetical protein